MTGVRSVTGVGPRSLSRAIRRVAGRVRRRARDLWRGETRETFFDLFDARELNAHLVARGQPPFTPDPADAARDVRGAVRFVLALLVHRPRLRRRFPNPLGDGPDGACCRWLVSPAGMRDTGLSPAGAANVRAAFASWPGDRVARVFACRPDLRTEFPLGLAPAGRGEYLGWLVTHGAADYGLTPEEAVWFLAETDAQPDRGLARSYLLHPPWQAAVPDGLTAAGWPKLLEYVRATYAVRGRWLRRVRRPAVGAPADRASGVNVLAHFRYASGLQEAAFATVDALHRADARTSLRDVPVLFECDWRDRHPYLGLESFDVSVAVTAVNTDLREHLPAAGLHPAPGVYRIGYWYWELSDLPADVRSALTPVDEVWAPTRFIGDAFRKHLRVPVVPMLPGVRLPAFRPRPRAHFGLPDDRFLVLFAFDMNSQMRRKNPLALVDAFRRAFRTDDRAHLVLKTSRGHRHPAEFATLASACRDAGATLIDEVLPREDTVALFDACDCYASLHRSEGLGLGMAEAMLLGKPVVATAYGGNLDFMTPDTALLVDSREVPIPVDAPPYPQGFLWAEPSLETAAGRLRWAYEHRDDAASLGLRGKRHAEEVLSLDAAGRRMAERLAAIRATRSVGAA